MPRDGAIIFSDLMGKLDEHIARVSQRCGLVSAGFASRKFLTCCLISRQVRSSVYVGEKVSDFTQPMRSAAGNVDQFLVSSSRVRCSLARQLVNLSSAVRVIAIEAPPRQLAVTSQLGTLSATAARVRRAEASVGQNETPRAEAAAMAIINRRNMTISKMACSYKPFQISVHRTARAAQRQADRLVRRTHRRRSVLAI
jgi:hypothetical protein